MNLYGCPNSFPPTRFRVPRVRPPAPLRRAVVAPRRPRPFRTDALRPMRLDKKVRERVCASAQMWFGRVRVCGGTVRFFLKGGTGERRTSGRHERRARGERGCARRHRAQTLLAGGSRARGSWRVGGGRDSKKNGVMRRTGLPRRALQMVNGELSLRCRRSPRPSTSFACITFAEGALFVEGSQVFLTLVPQEAVFDFV